MVKDTFFSTPVYYAGLADAETLNEHLKKDIRAWQKQDPEGTVRSNVAQAGAWHSATDMHTRGSSTGLPGKSSSWSRGSTMSSATTPTSSRFATPCGRTSTPGTPTIGIIPIPMRYGAASIMRRRPTNEVFYQPLEGRLIVFPAWLVHAVHPNLSEEEGEAGERISVSFNFYQIRRGSELRNPNRKEVVVGDLEPQQ